MLALCCDNVGSGCDKRRYLTTEEVYRVFDGTFLTKGWTVGVLGSPDLCPACTAQKKD